MKYDYVIAGAGFSGCVMAERLANVLNMKVLIIEKRPHIGGNAYDEYDEHGILVHRYGPHIFHTNNHEVFEYLSRFTEWRKYEHKVAAFLDGEYYPMPINRISINKLYNKNYTTVEEVASFYESVRVSKNPIRNSEDFIINKIGYDLFEKFYKHYTKKQWNHEPRELSKSVCGRIPIRTDDDCRYFTDKYQFMPSNGYSVMFKNMLSNKNIELVVGHDFKKVVGGLNYKKIIYTGPIDYYFDYKYGRLPYRSIKFEYENINTEYFSEHAQINFVGQTIPYTRLIEHKYLSGQESPTTTISKEYGQLEGEPYYPIPTIENAELYSLYQDEADKNKNVIFCGRLAEYKYYNMDEIIQNTLNKFQNIIDGK